MDTDGVFHLLHSMYLQMDRGIREEREAETRGDMFGAKRSGESWNAYAKMIRHTLNLMTELAYQRGQRSVDEDSRRGQVSENQGG